jgi:CRISPR-associated protein Cas2
MFSKIRWMRILVFYDLPVTTKALRRQYQLFHNFLIKDGYDMLQYSIYCRLCNGYDSIGKFMQRLMLNLPSTGHVRVLTVTEKQYAEMKFLVGAPKLKEKINKEQKQLVLF